MTDALGCGTYRRPFNAVILQAKSTWVRCPASTDVHYDVLTILVYTCVQHTKTEFPGKPAVSIPILHVAADLAGLIRFLQVLHFLLREGNVEAA